MSNYMIRCLLAIFCASLLFIAGCFPEDSLEWSNDGSVGLLQKDNALYLVDGQSGTLTDIAKGNVMPWPDISDDGKFIAYSERLQCGNLSDGLKLLPEDQARKIKAHAEWIKNEILTKGLDNGEFPNLPETRLKGSMFPAQEKTKKQSEYTEEYSEWVMRYLCENADDDLAGKLTSDVVSAVKNKPLAYYQLVIASCDQLNSKKVAATSVSTIFKAKFSPKNNHIAYLMLNPESSESNDVSENMSYQLCIASPNQNIMVMHVAYDVAFGYDWRQDGQAIAYMQGKMNNGDISLGELSVARVADCNGLLLANKLDLSEGSFATHTCQGHTSNPVGINFYPWSKLEYGPGDRIFFASIALTIPAITQDEPMLSLYCYDPVTNTVSNVLPLALSGYIDGAIPAYQFSLSQDGKKVLLPVNNNRFMIYEFGSTSAELPVDENEGFGDAHDLDLAPAWKGNNEISCLVSEKSHFLAKEAQEKHHRKEIVILDASGKFKRLLSENWPKEDTGPTAKKEAPGVPIEQLLK